MSNVDDDFARDETASVLGEAMAFASNEILILASLEEIFSPKPARLADSEESREALENRIQGVAQTLGGAPDFIIRLVNQPKAKYDTYANAALDEVLTMFNRARVSATRAHMFFMVSRMHQLTPDALKIPQVPKLRELLADGVQGAFWEHAETCLIRLASYWDRVGQLLDFAFFGIRQYERDGFPAVMDRIQNNWTAIDSTLREMAAWKALRSYQTSEQTEGLKWLLRRRNLLIHSMSLRPIEPDEEEPLFESAFNHLDSVLRKKLAPGSMQEELKGIHDHLAIAASQLPNVLSVTEHAAKVAFRPYPNGGA